jgi:hypothetical protein
MKKFKQQDKADKIFIGLVLLLPCILILGLVFAYLQMNQLERGILDVCATQQDAGVSFILEQINLAGDWEDEEIVEQILSTLDSSTNKYWTFSRDQTIRFIRDEAETNTWKGFTTATYFSSDSARDFLQQLRLNRVTHANITIGGEDYLASGVAFSHRDATYQLCLLTNRHTVLDNNSFLGTKIQYWILIVALLSLLMVIPMLLVKELRAMSRTQRMLRQTIQSQDNNLTKMSERFVDRDLHDTKNNLWSASILPKFIAGLQAREVSPVTMMRIRCHSANERQQFMAAAPYTLDRTVLRFEASGNDLILIFVGSDYDTAYLGVLPLLSQTITIQTSVVAGTPDGPTIEAAAQELEPKE